MGGFQSAKPIADVLDSISSTQYVLPAIQREFVWKDSKICALFDSLMRGYPIGGFLLWHVNDETVRSHRFYGFIKDFDVRPAGRFCPKLSELSISDNRYAILDGQQRLTSLNIGLRGSHTIKLPNKWWDNPDAFQKRWLYIDLRGGEEAIDDSGSDDETGDVEEYVFRFKTSGQAEAENEAGRLWLRVSDVLPLKNPGDLMQYAATKGFGNDAGAVNTFARLHTVVHVEPTISSYLEADQSIDRVMNIFIRVNAQGEPLSFADLLLSQATAAWTRGDEDEQSDAREEIRSFGEHLNRADHRFDFGRDQIMKACLVLTDANSTRFRIENYDTTRMLAIRDAWPDIKKYLDLAASLLEQFGLTAANLNARSVIHPVAYYLKHRRLDASYLEAVQYADDRAILRRWLLRSLLRQGIWGSGLDTVLTRLRDAIKAAGSDGFPEAEVEQAMASVGKSLAFGVDDVRGLAQLRYGERNCFALLSLLYPTGEAIKRHHVDHIYPDSMFRKSKLAKAGFDPEMAAFIARQAQEIPNLQLLTANENESKQDLPPATWLDTAFSAESRIAITALHHLSGVGNDLESFQAFFERRRQAVEAAIASKLGVALPPRSSDPQI